MTVVLWILQVLLAAVFLAAGGMKLARPKEALLDKMGVLGGYRPLTIKLIGGAEVLGAAGLILPPLVGLDGLVPWAALGLASVMVAAAIAHGERGEWPKVGVPVVLLALALVVVYGRSAGLPL
ncbi:DoxX family protein [Rubrivirga sp.]|uniref:DoxX family protein n=1 Tax=Rubrivirga sp. TaxID=1885344 RepID=UPI003B52EEAE